MDTKRTEYRNRVLKSLLRFASVVYCSSRWNSSIKIKGTWVGVVFPISRISVYFKNKIWLLCIYLVPCSSSPALTYVHENSSEVELVSVLTAKSSHHTENQRKSFSICPSGSESVTPSPRYLRSGAVPPRSSRSLIALSARGDFDLPT